IGLRRRVTDVQRAERVGDRRALPRYAELGAQRGGHHPADLYPRRGEQATWAPSRLELFAEPVQRRDLDPAVEAVQQQRTGAAADAWRVEDPAERGEVQRHLACAVLAGVLDNVDDEPFGDAVRCEYATGRDVERVDRAAGADREPRERD